MILFVEAINTYLLLIFIAKEVFSNLFYNKYLTLNYSKPTYILNLEYFRDLKQ